MSILVASLKRLFQISEIVKAKVEYLLDDGKLTQDEYFYIKGV